MLAPDAQSRCSQGILGPERCSTHLAGKPAGCQPYSTLRSRALSSSAATTPGRAAPRPASWHCSPAAPHTDCPLLSRKSHLDTCEAARSYSQSLNYHLIPHGRAFPEPHPPSPAVLSPRGMSAPQPGFLVMSGGIFDCHAGGGARCIWWAEASCILQHEDSTPKLAIT